MPISDEDILRATIKALNITATYLNKLSSIMGDALDGSVQPPVVEPEPPVIEPVPPVVEPEPPVIEPEPPVIEPEPPVIDDRSYLEKTYTPSLTSALVHVSSSEGNDSWSGTKDRPVKTIKHGLSLMRNGKPDWLLFKRGDVWVGETFGNIEMSGKSADEPMLFGSYGDRIAPRPMFNTLNKSCVNTFPIGNPPRPPLSIDFMVFVGLHFYCGNRVPGSANFDSQSNPTGFRWLRGTQQLTIDDCKFEYYHTNMIIQSYLGSVIKNVHIDNCQVLNAYSHSENSGHSQGIYADGIDGLAITDCLFDNNGYNLTAPHSEPTIFNHNIYVQKNCKKVKVADNIISRASSHGLQIRPGGLVERNFFYRNPINLLVGYSHTNLTSADVFDNVIVEGTKISDSLPRSWGIEFKNMNPTDVDINRNICVNRADDSPNARSIEVRSNVRYKDNVIYNWPPNNSLVDTSATYKDPNVSMKSMGFDFPSSLYNEMRRHSMDSKTLSSYPFIDLYKDGFTKTN